MYQLILFTIHHFLCQVCHKYIVSCIYLYFVFISFIVGDEKSSYSPGNLTATPTTSSDHVANPTTTGNPIAKTTTTHPPLPPSDRLCSGQRTGRWWEVQPPVSRGSLIFKTYTITFHFA